MWGYKRIVDISEFVGMTFKAVENHNNEEIIFTTENDIKFKMYHMQDCCECVLIESVIGDIEDLVGSPILMAEESTNAGDVNYGTYTWTFYKLATVKGYVDIRWYGSSNGYYSESVELVEL
jgi:hypothetical protein